MQAVPIRATATAAIGAVVIFDAMAIGRSAGEHARTSNWLLVFSQIRRGKKVPWQERPGHSPPEVSPAPSWGCSSLGPSADDGQPALFVKEISTKFRATAL
ncbi:hypothetical protein HM1_1299 [Heliomicrobium modesticaldum Ice1]|uniref:Uncharacterized protein n=1 Tax=Heliobacterium modesticaldum (strain ATCC 51547 / Ice1) TaxID=498761 RepID=B0TGL7_HELMI|nr:divergent PAP2 family protein [Heliomicrobium modesticaldum]ABZ83278.1 hypothetical protein HM1_1299 [Heliomicrobium modesticaldum Ice1]